MLPPIVLPRTSPKVETFVEARYFEKEKKHYIPEDWYGLCERVILDYTIPGIAARSLEDAIDLKTFLKKKVTYAISRIDTRQRESEVEKLLILMDTLATLTIPHFGEEPYATKLLEITSKRGNIHDLRIKDLENTLGEATKYWYKCSKEDMIYQALYHRDIARKCHLKLSLDSVETRIERMRISLKEIRGEASKIYFQDPN